MSETMERLKAERERIMSGSRALQYGRSRATDDPAESAVRLIWGGTA
jgi:hypothetical protein